MTFHDLALNRYSVRKFKDTKVEQDKIDKILEVARWAPTAKNTQPQRIRIILSQDDLAKTDECTPCRYGAPLMFLICYDEKDSWVRAKFDGQNSGETDATIVITHMMLQAHDIGLGTLYIKHFDPKLTTELFNLKKGIIPSALLAVGYAAADSTPSKMHFDKKPLSDILLD
jgi:nitroreductase